MKKDCFIQYKLENLDNRGYIICWLDRELKIETKVALKEKDGWFRVVERYGETDSESLELNRKCTLH